MAMPDTGALSALEAAEARGRELGKSEGYAQAIDDAVAVASEARNDMDPTSAMPIGWIAACGYMHKTIAALKENRRD